jgi:hypothetical protein
MRKIRIETEPGLFYLPCFNYKCQSTNDKNNIKAQIPNGKTSVLKFDIWIYFDI